MKKKESNKLQVEYGRHTASIFMLITGGQVTLYGTVFSSCQNQVYAQTAIALMLLASAATLAYCEYFLRKLANPPKLKNKLLVLIYSLRAKTDDRAFFYGVISSILAVLSLALFFVFISKAQC